MAKPRTWDFHLRCWGDEDLARDYAISGRLALSEGMATLSYSVQGPIQNLIWPEVKKPSRRDDLWQTTCFEMFCQGSGSSYYELNLSPSCEWAYYRFEDYRTGLTRPDLQAPSCQRVSDGVQSATFTYMFETLFLNHSVDPRCGITAVLHHQSGYKMYWALAHAEGAPDFHRSESFLISLSSKKET